MLAIAAAESAVIRGWSATSSLENAHAIIAISCVMKSDSRGRDCEAIAVINGKSETPKLAHAQAVLPSPCETYSEIRALAAAERESIRGSMTTPRVEHAQGVLPKHYGSNALRSAIDCDEIALSKGVLRTHNVAQDHAVFARF